MRRNKKTNNKPREFAISPDPNAKSDFVTNKIRTSRYTVWNFLPKAIIIQFRRLANIYFLITAVLQTIPTISSLSSASAIAPFIFVIALSVLREGFEDVPRQKQDKAVNNSVAKTLDKHEGIKEKLWKDIQVGDILLVKDGEEFPADLVVLKSSTENGAVFIETANLDGEKNLKPKFVPSEIGAYFEGQQVKKDAIYRCGIYAQAPDPSIYKFEGAFISEEGFKTALLPKQLLLRGAKLKNTEWILGAAVYTGHDTKIMRNAEVSKTKQSRVEKVMNRLIVYILFVQAIFCAIAAIGNRVWDSIWLNEMWYLKTNINQNAEAFYMYLSYFLLTNTMIPISLIVTIEIVKLIQAVFIRSDEDMYNLQKEKGAKVFCSSINEELGLVDYIFSDKTGTLTSNEMVFKNFVIGKEVYGDQKPKAFTSVQDEHNNLKEKYQEYDEDESQYSEKFNAGRITEVLATEESYPINLKMKGEDGESLTFKTHRELVVEFMQHVATCHECLAEKDKSGNIKYQGQSQDEVRLVETAHDANFRFLGGNMEQVQVDMMGYIKEIKILHIFDFTSDRRRMSVLIRDGTTIKLYIKGADSAIMDRLRHDVEQPYLETIKGKLDEFSLRGYRTLVFGMKVVSEEEYRKLRLAIDDVAAAADREERIEDLADKFERDLYLIGASAVEDRLQDNVPRVINDFLSADIKVWMLTGDKLETAENIAHSCRLIRGDMHVMRCFGKTHEAVKEKLMGNKEEYNLCVKENRKKALIVEGEALTFITGDQALLNEFTSFVPYCEAVVCCRAAPKQKAEMVRIVRLKTDKITLAIGDGANDVNMIQAANIGIGLYGHEGVQAVQASDYAIPEFQCLWKLLLVHGRWNYVRIAEMILYFFYKNMLFTLPQFYFAFINGFSAQTLYDNYYVTAYNLVFTAFPLGAKACSDKDVDYRIRLPHKQCTKDRIYVEDPKIKSLLPSLYAQNKKNLIFTFKAFLFWVFEGALMAVMLFLFAIFGLDHHLTNASGQPYSLWPVSEAIYTAIIFIVTVKICCQVRNWNAFFVSFVILLTFTCYFAFVFIYNTFTSQNSSWSALLAYESFLFYAFVIWFTGFEILYDFTWELWRQYYKPKNIDLLRRQQVMERRGSKRGAQTVPHASHFRNKSIDLPGEGIEMPKKNGMTGVNILSDEHLKETKEELNK